MRPRSPNESRTARSEAVGTPGLIVILETRLCPLVDPVLEKGEINASRGDEEISTHGAIQKLGRGTHPFGIVVRSGETRSEIGVLKPMCRIRARSAPRLTAFTLTGPLVVFGRSGSARPPAAG